MKTITRPPFIVIIAALFSVAYAESHTASFISEDTAKVEITVSADLLVKGNDDATEDIDESENWQFLQTIHWNGKGTRYDIPQFTVSGNFESKGNNGRVVLVQVEMEYRGQMEGAPSAVQSACFQ